MSVAGQPVQDREPDEHRSHVAREVRELKDAGWSDSEVIQVMGWSPRDGQQMLRRYLGEYSPKHLKSLPTTFEKYVNAATLTLRRPSPWHKPSTRSEEPKERVF